MFWKDYILRSRAARQNPQMAERLIQQAEDLVRPPTDPAPVLADVGPVQGDADEEGEA